MKKLGVMVLAFAMVASVSAQDLGGLLKKAEDVLEGGDINLSQEDIGNGLKEALNWYIKNDEQN